MSNEYQPQFEHDLAQAATPDGLDGGQVEAPKNPAESLRIGLIKLYYNYSQKIVNQLMSGSIDENRAKELTAQVDELSLADLGYEISKGIPLEIAKEIMGPNMCFGPDEVRKAEIEIREEIPPIPFTLDELERAKELGQMLIYRTSTTMQKLNLTVGPKLEAQGKGLVLSNLQWYDSNDIYANRNIQPGWALVSIYLNPGSNDKNYLEQSELLAEYLVNEVFKGRPLPAEYQEAIDELNDQKEIIHQLMDHHGYRKASQMLVDLKINQLFRQSPGEVLYDYLVCFQNTGIRLHEDDCVWTSARAANCLLVIFGRADSLGAVVGGANPDHYRIDIGTAFCRRGSDLKS